MYVNGIVIQKRVDNRYKGIDGSGFSVNSGENWYFNNDKQLSRIFEPFYDEHINLTYWNLERHSWVSACTDMEYINTYIEESIKRNIKYRILLCETEVENPVMGIPKFVRKEFLGYDYAYETGDNYSAVYNEIPYVFPQFELNENGLFNTEEQIKQYILERERYIKSHHPCTLESGDFIIFKLHELFF